MAQNSLMEFDQGVRHLAKEVLCNKPFSFGTKVIKFNSFENQMTFNSLKDQPAIERIMTDEFGGKLAVPAPESNLEGDYGLNGWLRYDRDEAGEETIPVLSIQMVETEKKTIIPVGSVRFKSIGQGPSVAEREKAREQGFQTEELKSGLQYLAKETLFQLKRDSFDPSRKSIFFAKVHNYQPHYILKNKTKIVDYMMEILKEKFTVPETSDFEKVDYIIKAYLFHDKTSQKDKKVTHRFQVQAIDARTGVRVSTAETKFDYFDNTPLIPAAYSRPPTDDETDFVSGEELDPEAMDIAFRIDTLAEKAFSLDGTEGRDEEIVKAYLDLIEKIGDNPRFKGELQDAYTNLFRKLYQMDRQDEAKAYLLKMLPLSIENSKTISFSPRFKRSSSLKFVDDEKEFYDFNLKILSEYLYDNASTVLIYGHTSITDIQGVNCRLSFDRGEQILKLLKEAKGGVDQKTEFEVRGRSFVDCELCQGEDEYDRRVTFKFIGKDNDKIDETLLMKCLDYGKEKMGLGYYDRHPNYKPGVY